MHFFFTFFHSQHHFLLHPSVATNKAGLAKLSSHTTDTQSTHFWAAALFLPLMAFLCSFFFLWSSQNFPSVLICYHRINRTTREHLTTKLVQIECTSREERKLHKLKIFTPTTTTLAAKNSQQSNKLHSFLCSGCLTLMMIGAKQKNKTRRRKKMNTHTNTRRRTLSLVICQCW